MQDDGETVEIGACDTCGEVKGPFEFEFGPLCPTCGDVLRMVWEVEQPADETIESDLTAAEYLDGGL